MVKMILKSFTALPVGALGAYFVFPRALPWAFYAGLSGRSQGSDHARIRLVFRPSEGMNAYQADDFSARS
jgi:hypothetical protein